MALSNSSDCVSDWYNSWRGRNGKEIKMKDTIKWYFTQKCNSDSGSPGQLFKKVGCACVDQWLIDEWFSFEAPVRDKTWFTNRDTCQLNIIFPIWISSTKLQSQRFYIRLCVSGFLYQKNENADFVLPAWWNCAKMWTDWWKMLLAFQEQKWRLPGFISQNTYHFVSVLFLFHLFRFKNR